MPRRARWSHLLALGLALFSSGCILGPGASGSFDRTLAVSGPVRLELQSGSGSVTVRAGDSGQARIHGEVHVRGWTLRDARQRLDEITANPPVEQDGNYIRVGHGRFRLENMSISYTVSVPADTELQAAVGSGSLDVSGMHGPAKLTTGSGHIRAADIGDETQVTTGSGGIDLTNVKGDVRATAGSGGVRIHRAAGEVRATTGSGGITIEEAGGRVTAKTGCGGVTVSGASTDLRVSAGSGHLRIEGNPAPNSYWDLRTGSGGVEMDVPPNASFRLYARTHSGGIETDLPILVEERSRRELRARVGAGAARIEIETGSGSIHIR